MKILITGATGFIGSNIAKQLLLQNFEVYATYRNSSSFTKCSAFQHKIYWLNLDIPDWKKQILKVNPDHLIHAAWGGIEAGDRNNWEKQIDNFWFSKELFDLAKDIQIKKVIALGSQAEYGSHKFAVNELTTPLPNDAYGAVKSLTANYLRNLFKSTKTEWYWIRVFSVFGEGENSKWLLPTVISKLLKEEQVQLTSGEQQYNYLYIDDFVNNLLQIILCNENKSGIYNICHSESIELKELLLDVAELMNVSKSQLKFGALPQREGQNMLIAGDNSKFKKNFPFVGDTKNDISEGLVKTIKYYRIREI